MLVIIEIKLNSSFPKAQFIIHGFRQPSQLNRNRGGGGVMTFGQEDIPSNLLNKHTFPYDIEGIFI